MAHPTRTTIDPPPFQIDPERLAKVPEGRDILYKRVSYLRHNGDRYLSYKAVYYEPSKKRNVTVQTVLYGVIRAEDAETGKVSELRPRNYRELEKQEKLDQEIAKRKAELDKVEAVEVMGNDMIRVLVRHIFDTRHPSRVTYGVSDVLLIGFLASLGGYTGATAAADYLDIYRDELEELFPHLSCMDITSETIRQIYAMIKHDEVIELVEDIGKATTHLPKILSMDGQAIRASRHSQNRPHMMMTLFDCDTNQSIRHIRIEDKSNEIPAGPKLMNGLNLTGCVVTMSDAMSTQRETAESIIRHNGHYCLALKGNQSKLQEAVEYLFTTTSREPFKYAPQTSVDYDHGRIETREYWILPAALLEADITWQWCGLVDGCLIMSVTSSTNKKTGEITEERRFFISSLRYGDALTPESLAHAIRSHWGIENKLHDKLDVCLRQDWMPCRDPGYLTCCATINKHALNWLEKMAKGYLKRGQSMSVERMKARLHGPKRTMKEIDLCLEMAE